MATPTFGSAVGIFVNLWLVALTIFGLSVCAVFLYILDAVDSVIKPPVAVSLVSASLSFLYLVLQSANVTNIKQHRWSTSRLGKVCVQLPRGLIVCWIITTAVGLVVALRQPLCKNGDVKTDAAAWEASLGCWVFRVLVSLNVVMLVLSFSIFIPLEINGRHVPIGLFHLEFASPNGHLDQQRRRTLVASAYGDSVVSLASPVTINSEDERNITGSTEKLYMKTAGNGSWPISPSPTYRTVDLLSARNGTADMANSRLSVLDEESIMNMSSRHSTCTTATMGTLPLSAFPATPTTSSQLKSRPLSMSNIPAVPNSFQKQIQELEALRNAAAASSQQPYLTNSPTGNFKSSCALPLSHPASNTLPTLSTDEKEKVRSMSLSEIIEQPPPAWCPRDLKTLPLTSDPAIKRLTEFRRNSKLGLDRVSRRFSTSGFEFGFSGTIKGKKNHVSKEGINLSNVRDAPSQPRINKGPSIVDFPDVENEKENTSVEAATSKTHVKTVTIESTPVVSLEEACKTVDRAHPIKSAQYKQPKSTLKNLSIMPPSQPTNRSRGHIRGPSESKTRKRGKSIVERGRWEKLSR